MSALVPSPKLNPEMKPAPVWKPHVTVATIVQRNGKYLFVEEKVRGELVINQPAGHLDPEESLIDAAKRETMEETAYQVEIKSLVGIYQWKNQQREKEFMRVAFVGEVVGHDPDAVLDDGIVRAIWLSREELMQRREQHRSPMVALNIEDFEAGRRYPLDIIRALHLS